MDAAWLAAAASAVVAVVPNDATSFVIARGDVSALDQRHAGPRHPRGPAYSTAAAATRRIASAATPTGTAATAAHPRNPDATHADRADSAHAGATNARARKSGASRAITTAYAGPDGIRATRTGNADGKRFGFRR
jgi:hypothetical protein